MQFDINGRLQLNGEALSSSVKKLTSGLGPAMEAAGAEAGAKLDRALDPGLRAVERKIESTFKRALKVTPDAGILDLDLPGLRAGAIAMEQQATQARALAAAKEALNRSSGVVTRAQQLEIAAAQNVATKYERQARAAREEVQALELLQAELGQTANAQRDMAQASGAQRNGLQQVGYQFQDFWVQVAGGTSAIRAASQQLPQLIGALQMMGNSAESANTKFGKFTRFLGGGFGVALGVAIPMVGMLVEGLLSSGDAAEEARKGALDLTQAIDFQSMSVRDLVAAIDELEAAQRKQLVSARAMEEQAVRNAARAVEAAKAQREQAIATLEALKATEQSNFAALTGGVGADSAQFALRQSMGNVDKQIKQLAGAQTKAELLLRQTEIPVLRRRIDAQTDPRKAADERRQAAQDMLDRQYQMGALRLEHYAAASAAVAKAHDKEIETLNKKTPAMRNAAAATQRLAERGEDAAKRIANITDRFTDMPSELQQTQRALRELDDLANDFALKKPPNYEQLLDQIEKARDLISNAPGRRLQKELDEELQHMEEAARLEAIRATEGEHAAEAAAEYLRIVRQFPTATPQQLAPLQQAIDKRRLQAELGDLADEVTVDVGIRVDKANEELGRLADEFEDLFSNGVDSVWERFERIGMGTIAKTAAELAMGKWDSLSDKSKATLREISGNAGVGAAAARMAGGNSLGGAFGGAIGGEIGKRLEKPLTDVLGKTLGSIAGPLGSIAGGLLGGVIGGLFKKTPMGSTIVTNNTANPVISGTKDAGVVDSLTGMSKGLQQNIQRIADQLGAEVGQYAVSFGQRGSYYRVAGTATNAVGNKHPSRTPGIELLYDGEDPETAMRLAVLNALQDGAIKGVREGTQKLLREASDIETGLSKALSFEQAFKDLKRYTDPVGAALDEVNLKFKQLVKIAKEAGATDEEMRQLEQLYKLQRDEAVKAAGVATDALKDFLQSLKAGSNSPLSLREQQANARAALDPFIADINAGKNVDTSKFQEAAQTFLQIERDINGSTKEYFAQYDMITKLTEQAISAIDKQNANNGTGSENPFEKAIAKNSEATANILEQQSTMLAEQTQLLKVIAGSGSLDTWWQAQRGY
ncbi:MULTISPECIES: hypothetical protein [unclassified Sphingobium]|uniref:hypothetical protein n=1 Tax=unclassified Sphingobium TaxID=2611147 RepID=UPI00222574A9|nr:MULTISPECIES: hypothetical protein [unclassified Sphingobium]MCW2412002.1 hypothetical protein [Sphingobium sp. B8D3D]MCW2415700.1 hypothetical protein [Sphingobium sp. B8D3A]